MVKVFVKLILLLLLGDCLDRANPLRCTGRLTGNLSLGRVVCEPGHV